MMWHPYKWLDDLAEKSGWWLIPYSLLIKIVLNKVINILPKQQVHAICIIFFSVVSFLGIRSILKILKPKLKYYQLYWRAFIVLYCFAVPCYAIYFLTNHPLLGSAISSAFFLGLAIVYRIILHFLNQEQA